MRTDMDLQVAVFTARGRRRQIYRSLGYEYEDAIVSDFHAGQLIEPAFEALNTVAFRARLWLERQRLGQFVPNVSHPSVGLGRDVDLFFVYPATLGDLLALNTIRDWRSRSSVAICHLQELWASSIPKEISWLQLILNQFDYVICSQYWTIKPLARELEVPVSYLPPGVDAATLCPWPNPSPRVIDACAIGKMDLATHNSLWNWDQRTGKYYRFTVDGPVSSCTSHVVHRQALSQTLQRSKYFFSYRAKRNFTDQRGEQNEFGPRYFEGAAAGTILVGEKVNDNPAFADNFDWEGAVVEAEYSEACMPTLIEELEGKPEWITAVRKANVVNCLMRHDHVHRWGSILEMAGFAPTKNMMKRLERLEALVEKVEEVAP